MDLYELDTRHQDRTFYLFQAGRLVLADQVKPGGKAEHFQPRVNHIIIGLDEYLAGDEVYLSAVVDYRKVYGKNSLYTTKQRQILLLPGKIYATQQQSYRSNEIRLADYPQQPVPWVEQKPANAQPMKFIPDTAARFAIRFHDLIYIVTIDSATGLYQFENLAAKMEAKQADRSKLPPWLMKPTAQDESVYELRLGCLTPGFIHSIGTEEWVFVPDLHGTVVEAATYLKSYQPWSRRIYNLPGRFER